MNAMSKLNLSAKEVLKPLQSGQTILVGGFGLIGAPLTLINELRQRWSIDRSLLRREDGIHPLPLCFWGHQAQTDPGDPLYLC